MLAASKSAACASPATANRFAFRLRKPHSTWSAFTFSITASSLRSGPEYAPLCRAGDSRRCARQSGGTDERAARFVQAGGRQEAALDALGESSRYAKIHRRSV